MIDTTKQNRLHIFTGKGGVGKTTLSISFTRYLQQIGEKVVYISLADKPLEICNKLLIPCEKFSLNHSINIYLGKKFKSKLIASWITKAPFLKACLQVVPGLNYVVLLGDILDRIANDPRLIVILDSPASGHALTLFESCNNFKEIFKTGLIFSDIQKMLNMLHNKNILITHICSLPTLLAMSESVELKKELEQLGPYNLQIIINNSFSRLKELQENEHNWPDFINKKIEIEQEIGSKYQEEIRTSLPYSTSLEYLDIINYLTPYMKNLL